jgi:hypothetical protein
MRQPDKKGAAQAWLIKKSQAAIDAHVKEWGYPDTTVRHWFVNGPYHPFWHWWMVAVVSLADIPGIPPANKQYPEAEYEFTIYSLEGEVDIDAYDAGDIKNQRFKVLSPPDVTFHFDGVTDKQAAEICDAAVQHIVAGQSCDSDFRYYWKTMLQRTVDHYKAGVHG